MVRFGGPVIDNGSLYRFHLRSCLVSLMMNVLFHRLKKLQKLLHAVLDLDQSTIAEIRGYSSPPIIVHTVMRATLLLLGHWKEETAVS